MEVSFTIQVYYIFYYYLHKYPNFHIFLLYYKSPFSHSSRIFKSSSASSYVIHRFSTIAKRSMMVSTDGWKNSYILFRISTIISSFMLKSNSNFHIFLHEPKILCHPEDKHLSNHSYLPP